MNAEIRHEYATEVALTPRNIPQRGLLFGVGGVTDNDILSPLVGVPSLHRVLENATQPSTPNTIGNNNQEGPSTVTIHPSIATPMRTQAFEHNL